MYVRASISAVRNNESKDEKRRRGEKWNERGNKREEKEAWDGHFSSASSAHARGEGATIGRRNFLRRRLIGDEDFEPLWIRSIVFEASSRERPMLVNNRGKKRGRGERALARRSHEAHPNALSSLAGERGHACVRETNATPVAQCPWSWTAMNVGIKWL